MLCKSRGLDIQLWMDKLISDQRSLRREIKRVVEDYEDQGRGEDQRDEGPAAAEEGTD